MTHNRQHGGLEEVAEHIPKLLDAVADKVPLLIQSLIKAVYSEETGRELGKAIGALYEELRNVGFSEEEAMEMAREYLRTQQNLMKLANRGLRFDDLEKESDEQGD